MSKKVKAGLITAGIMGGIGATILLLPEAFARYPLITGVVMGTLFFTGLSAFFFMAILAALFFHGNSGGARKYEQKEIYEPMEHESSKPTAPGGHHVRSCGVPGCETRHYARGLCRRCYARVYARMQRKNSFDFEAEVARELSAGGSR
jgi:hypothetical protein